MQLLEESLQLIAKGSIISSLDARTLDCTTSISLPRMKAPTLMAFISVNLT